MKKAATTAASAVTGFAVVLGAHFARSSPHSLALGGNNAAPTPTSSPTTSAPSKATGGGAVGPPAVNQTTTSAPTGQLASALGASEQYGYGVLSVKVTVTGSHITDVSVANLRTAESYSQYIAQQVIPILRKEVLQAQGIQVNGIAGATYTTEAYLLSVRSALQKLHV
ncbi:MAG: FMN-binding protein [Actinomycetota bacterium]|nr:FMN-binding protein [Actinomycetota bacterium]